MPRLTLFGLCLTLLLAFTANGKEKCPVTFGKISAADFERIPSTDTTAAAIILADVGSSAFEGNDNGWFTLVHKRTKRLRILKMSGIDAASITIPLYGEDGREESLENLKGYTYNLDKGQVVTTKLEKQNVFKEQIRNNLSVRKFTFPAVKAGAIIEFSYEIRSEFLFNLQPWSFQDVYPSQWSEYSLSVPEFFDYISIIKGITAYDVATSEGEMRSYRIIKRSGIEASQFFDVSGIATTHRWVVKNGTALKQEPFTSAISNYTAGIMFQLKGYAFPQRSYEPVLSSWPVAAKELMARDDFGKQLSEKNKWLDDKQIPGVSKTASEEVNARAIYAFVRDNFTCTSHNAMFAGSTMKELFELRRGQVAEINLLLAAILNHYNIHADPVILSTRQNGFSMETYPIFSNYNYVVSRIIIDKQTIYLDASHPYLGYGHLPLECYNGHARVIKNNEASAITLNASTLNERIVNSITITQDSQTHQMRGSAKAKLGYYESLRLREKIKAKGSENYFSSINKGLPGDSKLAHAQLDSLNNRDEPALASYQFTYSPGDEPVLYIAPMMGCGLKENPLTAMERAYPVEMPYSVDDLFILDLQIPAGYALEELPKKERIEYNEGEAYLEYMNELVNGHIRLRSHLVLTKATFSAEDYPTLRAFMAKVVKKQQEQIVLKKKA